MEIHCWKVILIVLYIFISCTVSFDPFSATVAAVGLISSYTYCRYYECCIPKYFPANFNKLQSELDQKVYGQHLAIEVVVSALKAHWNDHIHPPKALTLSFHGWPGGGKNYISNFIKDSLFAKGSKSIYVHHIIGRIHFPQEDKVEEYKVQVYNWIKGNVTKCEKQLFIFDEVDKMPPGMLNSIKPMIDYHDNVEGIDFRRSIFIFLSNTGQSLITDKAIEMWKSGVPREDIKLKDFESLITKGAFNEEGGFHHSDTIKSNLIDHYIPFLPMEEEHVRLCIIDQFKLRGVDYPNEQYIREVMEFVEWGPSPHNLFSKTGCKRLSQKVAVTIEMHSLHKNKRD